MLGPSAGGARSLPAHRAEVRRRGGAWQQGLLGAAHPSPGASRLHTHLSPPPGGAGGSGGARKRGSVARFRVGKLRAFPGRGVGAPAPGVEAALDLSLEQRGDISLVAPASTGLLNAQRSFFPVVSAEKLRREGADWETYCHPARARNGGLGEALLLAPKS